MFKGQKHAKARVWGGFSPKTRGPTIFTLMPYRYSSSLIFYPNLHTKFRALAPWEPRNDLYRTHLGLIQKDGVWFRLPFGLDAFMQVISTSLPAAKRGRGSQSVQNIHPLQLL